MKITITLFILVSMHLSTYAEIMTYYSFDDSTNPGKDFGKKHIDLKTEGTPQSIEGKKGKAVSFNGTDSLLTHESSKVSPNLVPSCFR